MIYSLTGKIILAKDNFLVVQCGGVGYKCMCSLFTQAALREKTEEVTVYTYLNVHQDSVELFGFSNETELEHFKLLISVSGVGPKASLGILSCFPSSELAGIISNADSKALTSAPGIGAKTAKRIILELKDKFSKINSSEETESIAEMPSSTTAGNKAKALNALMSLGFSKPEITPWLANLSQNLSVDEMISMTLKNIGKGG